MNQREAQREACRMAATILDRGEGCPIMNEDEWNRADHDRLEAAWQKIVDGLWRRAGYETERL